MVDVTAIVRATVAATGAPRAQRYGTEDASELLSGMLFGWIQCQPQERMPGHGAEDLSVLFERIVHCKQNLPRAFRQWGRPAALSEQPPRHTA